MQDGPSIPHQCRWIQTLGGEAHVADSVHYLGWGHMVSCCFAPYPAGVCKAAASLPGCTCSCGRSGDCAGPGGACFCWKSLPRRHRTLLETLMAKIETALLK